MADEVYIYKYSGVRIPVKQVKEKTDTIICEVIVDKPGYEKGETKEFDKNELEDVSENPTYGLTTLFE